MLAIVIRQIRLLTVGAVCRSRTRTPTTRRTGRTTFPSRQASGSTALVGRYSSLGVRHELELIASETQALNIAANDYEVQQLDLAYAAAIAQKNFQLFYSFDMSYSWDAGTIETIIKKYATSSATYKWNDKVCSSLGW